MSKVLIVAEHMSGRLCASTAKCVTCARDLSDAEVHIVVLAEEGGAVAAEAAVIEGVARVVVIDNPANSHALAAILAPQIAALAADYTHVLGPSTTFGKDLMPRVAALLDAPQVSDIMQIESGSRFRRPVYAGNAIVTVEVREGYQVVGTVRVASYETTGTKPSAAPIVAVSVKSDVPTHTRFVSISAASSGRPDLQTATRVVSGGRALGSAEQFALINRLADRIGAAVGASRAAVDAGYVSNELQVGQTGKIIAPELYIAIGISGAIQHVTGIKDARTIVAINKDPEAPIFEIADYGLVGDLFSVIPEIEELLA